jgi:transcriptional regulator with XRE-family HTH domain
MGSLLATREHTSKNNGGHSPQRTFALATTPPHPTDKHVGSRVRMRRLMLGMSQEKLAEQLGITFQQVQKYEKGTNRVSAGRLQQISQILDVPVAFFFEQALPPGGQSPGSAEAYAYINDFLASTDGLALAKAFMRIDDPALRRSVVRLVEAIAHG